MKEIYISRTIADKRKEKNITQSELANFIGVSKSSVSKWETGQSYPDITFLPLLASYFNISLDELMQYKPQISKEEICILYHKLSDDFTKKPFDDVLNDCRRYIKKYFSCFPLLLQIGVLILFHSEGAKSKNDTIDLIIESKDLFIRVKDESTDIENIIQAKYMEANCYIALGDSQSALKLLEDINKPILPMETIIATAYKMEGKINEGLASLQIGIYQYVTALLSIFPFYLMMSSNEPNRFEEALQRAFDIVETFDVKHLLPASLLEIYLMAAHGYIIQENIEQSIYMLQKFTEIATSKDYKLKPHSDGFFDLIDNWLTNLDLGAGLVKNEKTLKGDMTDLVLNNNAFSILSDDYRFCIIIDKLSKIKG
ncbi:helix-turn-helix domain-containing protein [Clostridioides mangenotii]|uniref:helix-turn-helix domain-containing protein n=1 Tax=Metaclostridioides mangenotii TaxID=1540 RepID=UPI002149EA1D|nr:helix-turn-helix domain-containing protein [Clostridioides mangenotii]MCR1955964.1 helix-turn-helix domain-containing protein [Clostridioides mangenotii]